MVDDEMWVPINGTNGLYEISNKGRIKSYKVDSCGFILKNTNRKNGYFSVVLAGKNIKTIHTRVHCLVAVHFVGERPSGYHIHHKDGNKQNNDVENLEYISTIDHYQETKAKNPQIVTGMTNYNKFVRPRRIVQLDKFSNIINIFNNSVEAGEKTGVCSRNILQVASGEEFSPGRVRKQAGGFIWKFE